MYLSSFLIVVIKKQVFKFLYFYYRYVPYNTSSSVSQERFGTTFIFETTKSFVGDCREYRLYLFTLSYIYNMTNKVDIM